MNKKIKRAKGVRFFVALLFVFTATLCYARGDEPGNNLGKTISELRQVFPNAHYVRTEAKGDFYTDGEDPSEGLSCFFYLRNFIIHFLNLFCSILSLQLVYDFILRACLI